MYTKRIILFLCLTIIINVTNAVLIAPGKATDETVSFLNVITAKQALPLIAFQVKKIEHENLCFFESDCLWHMEFGFEIKKLEFNVKFASAEIKNGRLTSKTKFYSESSNILIYLCLKSNSETNEQCLAPKRFEQSQILECDLEPIPNMNDANLTCGPSGTGSRFGFGYKICPAEEPYKYKDSSHDIYNLCYDKTSKKIITASYLLDEAALLEDKLFTREREIIFEINTETYGHIDPDYHNNLIHEAEEKSEYMLQQLVPTEDMALATSRKTTQYFANFALQLKALTNVWNDIRKYFRDHAIERKYIRFGKLTGVFDVPESEITFQVNEKQKVNIWITIMTEAEHTKGLAVIINNFIINDPKNQDADTSTSKQPYIDQLCIRNLCTDSLKKKFNAIGVEGRCCAITQNILDLFSRSEVDEPIEDEPIVVQEILSVKNINF